MRAVGRWHLRPVLQELEKDREIFVVMDSCYSGNAVRSLDGRPRFKTRQIPISLEGDTVAAPAAGERKSDRGEASLIESRPKSKNVLST